jgi:hypothetical protein
MRLTQMPLEGDGQPAGLACSATLPILGWPSDTKTMKRQLPFMYVSAAYGAT